MKVSKYSKHQTHKKSFETLSKTQTTEMARPFGVLNIKNVEVGPFGETVFFSKKSLATPKKLEGGPFSLAQYCMLRGKKEKPFSSSSLGQMVQLGTIKFCRTILATSCGLKKSLIFAFHFMKRRLKWSSLMVFLVGAFSF